MSLFFTFTFVVFEFGGLLTFFFKGGRRTRRKDATLVEHWTFERGTFVCILSLFLLRRAPD